MIDYRNIIRDRELRLKIIQLLSFIPDATYLKIVFWIKTGKLLNLTNPVTFCDKQNWLKIHKQNKDYSKLVDKVTVRDYVNEKLGRDMFFPLLGVWEKYEDINFDQLPDSFVMKCNHDSASVKIIKDKKSINHEELKKYYNGRLSINTESVGREYPYGGISPKIIAEKFMVSQNSKDINDYKFFCFGGKPKIMFVATERSTDCRFDFYDMQFNHLDIVNIHPNSDKVIDKPSCFEEMIEIATKLSQGIRFVRIDLYEIDGKVYFGEFTFFHGGGFWPMYPETWERKLGEWININ